MQVNYIMLERVPDLEVEEPSDSEDHEVLVPDSSSDEEEEEGSDLEESGDPEIESANGQPEEVLEEFDLPAPDELLVLQPDLICTSCAACHQTVRLGVLGTRDGVRVVETLLISSRLSLLCPTCIAEIGRVRHAGIF